MLARFGTRTLGRVICASPKFLCTEVPAIPFPAIDIKSEEITAVATKTGKKKKPKKKVNPSNPADSSNLNPIDVALSKANAKTNGGKWDEVTKSEDNWVYLSGFSKFFSRRDLQLFMGPHKPIAIDPCLSRFHQFVGSYALKFDTKEKAADFKAHVKEVQQRSSSWSELMIASESWIKRHLVPASQINIGHNTLRVDPNGNKFSPEQLVTVFEDYGVVRNDVSLIKVDSVFSHFLVQFRTVQDAQRALVENDKKFLNQDIVNLVAFQC